MFSIWHDMGKFNYSCLDAIIFHFFRSFLLFRFEICMMKRIIYLFFIIFLCSCSSSKKAVVGDSRYYRPPIVEVSEEQLKADGELIDATTQALLGKRTETIESYQKIIAKNPRYDAAHYGLGKVFLQAGWLDSALYHTKMACRLNDSIDWYRLQLAQIYQKQQDGKNLIATWEDLVKRSPDVIDYYYELSNAYLVLGNVQASIEVLNRVEKRYGVTEMVSLQKHRLWNAVNMPNKARKELEALSETMPNEPRYHAILAESYMNEKNYAKALQYYQRVLTAAPDDEDIHISMASCYLSMGDMAQAYAHLRQGVLVSSIDCKTRLHYITEFLSVKSFFVAYSGLCFRLADTVAGQCPAGSGHDYLYGQILASQSRYKEAAEHFWAHLESDKSQYEVWDALLVCEAQLDDRADQLMEHAQQAADLFPFHLRPYAILAAGYFAQGDCEMAQKYIKRCMAISPNDSNIKQLNQEIIQQCSKSAE